MLSSNIIIMIINNQCMRRNTVLGCFSRKNKKKKYVIRWMNERRRQRTVRTYLILYVDNNECEYEYEYENSIICKRRNWMNQPLRWMDDWPKS